MTESDGKKGLVIDKWWLWKKETEKNKKQVLRIKLINKSN